jgi:hypothetical protein
MADSKTPTTDKPVVAQQDHDRVVSLSIAKDGTPDQNNPEIIGDKDAALAFTKRQFAEMAVSAVDAEKRSELGLGGDADSGPSPDAAIDALRAEHDKAAAAAEKSAESIVNALHKG